MRLALSLAVLGLVAPAVAQAPGAAQTATVRMTNGTVVRATLVGTTGTGADRALVVREIDGTAGQRSLPLADVLSIHAAAPRPTGDVVVHLVGGDELRGTIGAGDDAGESFTVRSRSLGQVRVPVDRLAVLLFPARAGGVAPATLVVPAEAEEAEALFRPVERGFDMVLGAIERFTADGVLFDWGAEDVELFPYDRLAAVALRDGLRRRAAADARLLTRSGDVVSIAFGGIDGGRLRFKAEGGGESSLALTDVAALTFLREDRVFLSTLEPLRIEQKGTPFPGADEPLYGFRRDRAVTGGFLVVGGVPFVRGLGVHARCVLTYRVPEGCTRWCGMVGIDDSVLETAVRGTATVKVTADGNVVFGPREVKGGRPPRNIGAVPVEPGTLLTLEADFGDGWFIGDRVDWLSGVFLRR